jgi:hypothetical protein
VSDQHSAVSDDACVPSRQLKKVRADCIAESGGFSTAICRAFCLLARISGTDRVVNAYGRGMTVSTRATWVRNSAMKLLRNAAIASSTTSPSAVKTSGEYRM